MGGIVPNPLAAGALKFAAYVAYGALLRRSAETPRSAVAFGALRAAAGWGVGGVTLAIASSFEAPTELLQYAPYAAMSISRILLWLVLIRSYFRPSGGRRALLAWTGVGLILSIATDAIIFGVFPDVELLRMTVC